MGTADLWDAGRTIEGTIGERHLRERRGIARASWPSSVVRLIEAADFIRFVPGQPWGRQPALMIAATDASGSVTEIQIISLDTEGNDALLLGEGGRQTWTVRERGNEPVRWPGEGEPAPLLLARDGVTAGRVPPSGVGAGGK